MLLKNIAFPFVQKTVAVCFVFLYLEYYSIVHGVHSTIEIIHGKSSIFGRLDCPLLGIESRGSKIRNFL